MADATQAATALAGAVAMAAGVTAQLRLRAERARWRRGGLGFAEPGTGLATLASVPLIFPAELERARAQERMVGVVLLRRPTRPPEELGAGLTRALRDHEPGLRVDWDLFAVLLDIDSPLGAVRAASRLGRALAGSGPRPDLRMGIALCPADGTDFLDVVEVARRRMRGVDAYHEVADQHA